MEGCCCGLFSSVARRSKVPLKRYNPLTTDLWVSPKQINDEVVDGVLSKAMMRRLSNLADYAEKNPNAEKIGKISRRLERRAAAELELKRYGYVHVAAWGFIEATKSTSQHLHLWSKHVFKLARTLFESQVLELNITAAKLMQSYFELEKDSTFMSSDLEGLVTALQQLALKLSAATWQASLGEQQLLRYRTTVYEALREFVRMLGRIGVGAMSSKLDLVYQAVLKGAPPIARPSVSDPLHLEEVSLAMESAGSGTSKEMTGLSSAESLSALVKEVVAEIARLAKDGKSARMVLQPLFNYFDANEWWLNKPKEVAMFLDIQHSALLVSQQHYVLISQLIKHLREPTIQASTELSVAIVRITTSLAQKEDGTARSPSAVLAIYLLAKSIPPDPAAWANDELTAAVVSCVEALARQVGDAAQVVEVIAGVLEAACGDDPPDRILPSLYCLVDVAKVGASHDTAGNVGFAHCFSQNLVVNMAPLLMAAETGAFHEAHRLLASLLGPTAGPESATQARPVLASESRGRRSSVGAPTGSRFTDSQADLLLGTLWACVQGGHHLDAEGVRVMAASFRLVLHHTDPQGFILTQVVPLVCAIAESAQEPEAAADAVALLTASMLDTMAEFYGAGEVAKLAAEGEVSSKALAAALSRVPALATAHGGVRQLRTDLMKPYEAPPLLASLTQPGRGRPQTARAESDAKPNAPASGGPGRVPRTRSRSDGENGLSPRSASSIKGPSSAERLPSAKQLLRSATMDTEGAAAATGGAGQPATTAPSFAQAAAAAAASTAAPGPSSSSDPAPAIAAVLARALHHTPPPATATEGMVPPVTGIDGFRQAMACF